MVETLSNEAERATVPASTSAPKSAAQGETLRLRFTVPAADVSVQEWIATQDKLGQSIRALIRESIERDGYVDVINRPVQQLPRRGRPAVSDGVTETPVESAAAPVPAPVVVQERQQATAPVAQPVSVPEPQVEPEQSSGEQIEVSDLFGSLRNR